MALIKEMHTNRQQYVKTAETYINHPARMQEYFRNNPEMRKKMERDPQFKELAENQDKIRALGKFSLTPEYESSPASPSPDQAQLLVAHIQQNHASRRSQVRREV